MTKTLYLNLEDDVAKIAAKLKREKGADVVLVIPKGSYIFSDSINMRLLKKQVDMLAKNVSILTMDEKGQNFAQEAGFALKHLPKTNRSQSFSDIRFRSSPVPETMAVSETPNYIADDFVEHAVPTKPTNRTRSIEPEKIATPRPKKPASKKVIEFTGKTKAPHIKTGSGNFAQQTFKSHTPLSSIFEEEKVESKDNIFLPPNSKLMDAPRPRRSYRGFVIGFVATALIVVLLLVLVILPSANITVFAKSQTVARDIDVIADTKIQTPDSQKLTVPATAVQESQTIAGTFQTNGKKELGSKAEGRVALYNLTGSPLALKASTTTLTIGSKSYTFKSDQMNVKALTSPSADTNATLADIVASDGGESFNVPAGTRMEITNVAFGSKPQKLYAKTVTQVIGGNSRFVSSISKDDLTNAQNSLIKKVVDGINANLASANVKLVDGAYDIGTPTFTTDKPEGTETQSFTAQLQVTITGLAFDETALKNMVRSRLLVSLGAEKTLQDLEKDTVIYQIKNLDPTNGVMQLALHYESQSKPNIEESILKNKLAGKSKQEASELILSNPDVDHVEMVVQPTWATSLPRFTGKIHLEVKE